MNSRNFFTELKRRNVYRAAVAYGGVAWFLTQLTMQVFPFFEIPNSAVRFVVIALPVGFPIAMLLSWLRRSSANGRSRSGAAEIASAFCLDFVSPSVSPGCLKMGRFVITREERNN
jgi:hypothetical protein